MQGFIPIEEIVTMMTANVVMGALLVSLIGATVAMGVRHLSSQNWSPNYEDLWYYVFGGSIAVAMVLLGMDTPYIISVTTGVNTPLALLKTGYEKYTDKKAGVALNAANIEAIKAELVKREAELKHG